jgi:hypothetical protein
LLGQTVFNGRIKFNCRVGLPPFGIIGIPVRVTGTGQQPIVKTGKTDRLPLGTEGRGGRCAAVGGKSEMEKSEIRKPKFESSNLQIAFSKISTDRSRYKQPL